MSAAEGPARPAWPDRPARAGEDVRRARAYLSRVAEAPAPALAALVAELGPVEAAARVRRGAAGDLRADVLGAVSARCVDDHVDADLDAVAALGGRLVVPEDAEWPALAFCSFPSPRAWLAGPGARRDPEGRRTVPLLAPLALWVRGPLPLVDVGLRSVAVVGSRAASDYGLWVARDWAAGLATRDVPVVSGAALGVDGAAHRGALAAEGTTLAVLACGLDRPYPPRHEGLLEHVAARGAVVSEYPPGTTPARGRFLVRNRLIAALAGGTLLVEAAARSGAQSTARQAAALGRAVMAVPGPVSSALSVGCHALVRGEEAFLVGGVDHVVEHVGHVGDDLAARPGGPARATDGLGWEGLALYDALSDRAARDVHRLAQDSGVDPAEIATHLSDLAGRGLAREHGGRWCRHTG